MRLLIAFIVVLNVIFGSISHATNKGGSPDEFYRGKTVDLVIPFSAGGTVDLGGRLLAAFWPQYVKGGVMTVSNLKGGGGVASHNYVMKGKIDGLTMCCTSHPAGVGYPLYKAAGVDWKIKDMQWIGMLGKDIQAFSISPKLPYKSMDEMQKAKGLKLGGLGPGGAISLGSGFIAAVFELDAKVILGYRGTSELAVATGKGELDGYTENAAGVVMQSKQGFCKPLCVLSTKRSPLLPNTPAVTEIIKLTPDQQTWLSFFEYLPQGNSFFVRDGIPVERVKFLQDAFDKIIAMPRFQTQMKTTFGEQSEALSGKDVTALVNKLLAVPQEAVDRFLSETNKYMFGAK